MDLSTFVNLLLVCLCTPAALLPYYNECTDQGGRCVTRQQCSPGSQMTSSLVQCTEGTVCCISYDEPEPSHVVQLMLPPHGGRFNRSRLIHRPRAQYLKDGKSTTTDTPSGGWEYSVHDGEEDEILDIALIEDTGTADNTLTETSVVMDGDKVVLPENPDERLKFFQNLYKEFAINFEKKNKVANLDDPTKRKFKYATGHKSVKYCKRYERYLADPSINAIPLLPSPYPILLQKSHCSRPLPLIVSGTNSLKGEFPHMAGLGYDRGEWIDFLCGGSLISERYVLTAAHCGKTKWGPPIIVRLGTRNLITDVGQNMDVEKVIVHPDYQEPSCNNDIALIRIAPGLELGKYLRPACLPQLDTPAGNPGSILTATGWGRTGYGLFSSPILQKVKLQVVDNRTCDDKFLGGRKSERLPNGIQDSMLCAAGFLDPSHDTCQGDSGGPLQRTTQHSKCMYEIIGITSFGKLCGTGIPAIYTRVSNYIAWIEDIVWPS